MSFFPKVTIILATFNRAHFIIETLISIQNQTYQNWECIIVDDYSVDNTKEVIGEFIKKDNRFSYYLKIENYKKGLSGTRNQGLDIAASKNAEYIQLFDDDDIMHPQKLELQIEPMLNDESLGFTTCKYRHYYGDEILKFNLKDEDCNIFSQNLFEDFYVGKMRINSLGPIWKANLILKYRFDEDLPYAEERDLYLKLFLLEKPKYKNIDFVLFYYRKHLHSNTSGRYNDNIMKIANYKSDLNLYSFIQENTLWNYFLLKVMIKKYIIYSFDYKISEELMLILKKNKINLGFKRKILKAILFIFIKLRKNVIRIINKI
jgi:GalNAc5-diNAcBac-PP-undecaprenol beta-1,3-glucosyltransferase